MSAFRRPTIFVFLKIITGLEDTRPPRMGRSLAKRSLTIPSSAVDVPVLEDNGGEGVAERNEDAPDESTGEGKLG